MGVFHQKVNIFNLIIITTVQAALNDVVIYVVLAWQRQGRKGLRELYAGIGSLMSVAIGTTIAGFAGMLFTNHLGIISMGAFATISLGSCLAVSLCFTPWLCTKLLRPVKYKSS
jgi:predicted exporter